MHSTINCACEKYFINNDTFMCFTCDSNYLIKTYSDAVNKFLGYAENSLIGKNCFDFIFKDDHINLIYSSILLKSHTDIKSYTYLDFQL